MLFRSGLLQSALLFYHKLRKELEDYGFEVNPYDPCVANKIINGSQMTVTWHVDDLKVSHKGNPISKTKVFWWDGFLSRTVGKSSNSVW